MMKTESYDEMYMCGWCESEVIEEDLCYCERCGLGICVDCAAFDEDSWQALCPDCYEELMEERQELIASYHQGERFAPVQTLEERLTARPFAGVGLETEVVGDDNYDCLRAVKSLLDDKCTFERDCTVDLEMISAPLSFAYLKKNVDKYRKAFDMLEAGGYGINYRCGAHVHFSRECFGVDTEKQGEVIAKVLSFYTLFNKEMLELSERQDIQYCGPLSGSPLEYKNGERVYGKHIAVNCENSATIEFRLLQGTLDFNKVYNWILFHKGLIERAKSIPWDKIGHAGIWMSTMKCDGVPSEMTKRFLDLVRKYHGDAMLELCGYQPHFYNVGGEEVTLIEFPVYDVLRQAQYEADRVAHGFSIGGSYSRRISETEYTLHRKNGEEYARIIIERASINWN